MLSDRERQALCEIERRLRDEDPALAHTLERAEQPPARDRRSHAWSALIIVAGLLAVFLLALGQPAGALAFALVAGWAWGALDRRIWPGTRHD
ncbi:DUF3040 domain-containing protein [Lentzea terrae]|uniref:DUF3040 domain-containing protein n=1 Tax=Lentzea terrae TaxID=2200761 RepID=UPI000DD438B4|nr:DUF3040 domain-containing protein [Lentzea terrae]